ncbi:fumarate reductase flavoprotein subunit [Thermomonospora echinospora]|uniref:Fumarate reductase flavoprotein subunit n=1 Tax=Thermomonospora echinospora TaxID=1992 RepID=A0A1H5U134_9ACTN|nr:FAD-dependent oxidoreductase [Thermomonospora echinospora]SEF68710.1 fumarate reductase flavoprotein subunit [Thermomonospora echinospora]
MTTENLGRFDVVVVGAGTGGLCTAIEAATGGARVLLIDKQQEIGGMLHIANGEFSGAGTRRQAAHGISDTPEEHFAEVMRLSHGKADERLAWQTVRAQGRTVDWLESQGFEFDPATPGLVHGHEVYSVPRTYWGVRAGLSVIDALRPLLDGLVEQGAVTVRFGVRIEGAVVEDGRVAGVTGTGPDGGEVTAYGDAVVLATGGYDANLELRNRFLPPGCENALIACLDHATGDGLVLAEELGAGISGDGYFIPVMGLIPDPGRPGFAVDYREAFVEVAPAYRTPYEIWVNRDGERFVAEDTTSPEHRERALLRQPGIEMHIIWDQAIAAAAEPLIRNGAGDWTPERMRDEHSRGRWIVAADSLEELAGKLGVSPGGLVETVRRYNEAVAAGHDPDHGRTTLPIPISQAPYYALTSVAASLLSRDGLRVNGELAVLDREGDPIPGLYAVGEVLGNNVFAGDNYVGGMSVTPAMTLGRELGRALAARRGSGRG